MSPCHQMLGLFTIRLMTKHQFTYHYLGLILQWNTWWEKFALNLFKVIVTYNIGDNFQS
jgi:hypothetical protein